MRRRGPITSRNRPVRSDRKWMGAAGCGRKPIVVAGQALFRG
jgi:hypothetical protein